MKRIVGHPNHFRDEKGVVHIRNSKSDIENARKARSNEVALADKVNELESMLAQLLEEKS